MQEPVCVIVGTDYRVSYGRQIVFNFSQTQEDNGRYRGMLRVDVYKIEQEHAAPLTDMLYNSELVLSDERSKYWCARACEAIVGGLSWKRYVDRACMAVIDKMQKGATIVDLAAVEIQPEQYTIWPICPIGSHTLLFGSGGSLKSYFCLACTMMVGAGLPLLGLDCIEGKTLYLDYEDNANAFAWRLRALSKGFSLPETPKVFYKAGTASLPALVDILARDITSLDVRLLVIDSAVKACGGDPNNADVVANYFNALQLISGCNGCSTLTIAHHSKDDDSKPFASVYWENSPRNVYKAIVAHSHIDRSRYILTLRHTKSNTEQKHQDMKFGFAFGDGLVEIERQDGEGDDNNPR